MVSSFTSSSDAAPESDEAGRRRLRRIAVGVEKSAFHPPAVPQLIEECFNQVLATAQAIHNLFEHLTTKPEASVVVARGMAAASRKPVHPALFRTAYL
jgi:hypothetical protein